jgi:hypothetical protein
LSAATCVTCARPVPGTEYACTSCSGKARHHLDQIADLAGPARDVAHGQTRRGPAVAGGHSSGLPINLSAGARLDAVANTLIGWVRVIARDRGGQLELTGEPIADTARYLAGHVDWMRHQQWVAEAHNDFEAALRVLRGVVDGRPDRRWLGQCGTPTDDGACRTDLYTAAHAATAKCRTCGTEAVVADRRRQNEALARGYAYTAAEIAAAYPEIRADRIRQWASRGRILPVGEHEGRPTYDLGEVLDRAAQEAARLATEQAKRARRKATDDENEAA